MPGSNFRMRFKANLSNIIANFRHKRAVSGRLPSVLSLFEVGSLLLSSARPPSSCSRRFVEERSIIPSQPNDRCMHKVDCVC